MPLMLSNRTILLYYVAAGVVLLIAVPIGMRVWHHQHAAEHNRQELLVIAQTLLKLQQRGAVSDLVQWTRQADDLSRLVGVDLTLLDQRGRVLLVGREVEASPLRQDQRQAELQEAARTGAAYSSNGGIDRLTIPVDRPSIAAPADGEDAAPTLQVAYLQVSRRLPPPDTPWTVIITITAAVLSIWLIGAAAIIAVRRKHRRQLAQITSAVNEITQGEYPSMTDLQENEPSSRDLLAAWNRMRTELRERNARLVDNNYQLQAVLASMIEGVIAVDADGRVLLINPAASEMLGLTRGAVLGRPLLELVRIPEFHEAAEYCRGDLGAPPKAAQQEFETIGRGRRRIRLQALPMTGQPPSGAVFVLYDVTELRQLETMRRDFVANVSHELKTPLASIKAYAETLRMGAMDDPEFRDQFLEQIETQADLLASQIRDLLQLARVESGQVHFEMTSIHLLAALNECVDRFSREAQQREIALHVDPDSDDVVAEVDREGLQSVLNNLVSNAIRYTRSGGSVTVRCAYQDGSAVVEVIDTGIGIAPEHHQRVFERFYRVDRARSRDLGGTGLGLAIVKHTALGMGGSVELDSRLGRGSTFRLRLRTRLVPSTSEAS